MPNKVAFRILMPLRLTIAGQLNAGAFHKAKAVAESAGCALDLSVVSLQPADYEEWKAALRRELGGLAWRHKAPVACYTEDEFIGDDTALLAWLRKQRVAFSASALNSDGKAAGWDELADAAYLAHLSSTGFSYAFLDLQLDGEPFGRLVFELYKHLLPKTVANFEALCAGGLPSDGARPRPLEPSLCSSPPALLCSARHLPARASAGKHYLGSRVHRIVGDGWLQVTSRYTRSTPPRCTDATGVSHVTAGLRAATSSAAPAPTRWRRQAACCPTRASRCRPSHRIASHAQDRIAGHSTRMLRDGRCRTTPRA